MEPEKWQQVKLIFDAVLRKEPSERSAFLDQADGCDAEIRAEVKSLLASFDTSFMEKPGIGEVVDQIIPSGPKLTVDQSLAHYKIIKPLGAGGMGEVYLAQDTKLHRRVAIKVLPSSLSANSDANQRFSREARAAATLDHPNICSIYEIGEHDGSYFIVMQYVDGETLAERLAHTGLTSAESLEIAIQMADALDEAQSHGIIHRDIKPSNVIVNSKGKIKILDFGLAKFVESKSEDDTAKLLSTSGAVMGTVPYMSPEQVRGKKLDGRTDIFSLGAMLYEILSDKQPFARESNAETISAILNDDPAMSEIPVEFQAIVGRALNKDLEKRHQNAGELLNDLRSLRSVISSETAGGTAKTVHTRTTASPIDGNSTSSAEYIVNQIKSHKAASAVAAALLMIVASVLAFFAFRASMLSPVELPPTQRTLTQLTFGSGFQSEPTWSPDGRYVAYSSETDGNLDIWVQQVTGGNPVQITRSAAPDWQPDWSPDGSNIVFRSERDTGGIFTVPALGGSERKISPFGYQPRWSPDGAWILFYNSNLQNVTAPPRIFVADTKGSPPREILTNLVGEFPGRLRVAWHPDGKRISLWGYHRRQGLGFWTIPLEGGEPAKSEFSPQVAQQIRDAAVDLFDFRWAKDSKALYFEGVSKGVRNLWKVATDPKTLGWTSGLERLTTGAGLDRDITLSPDGKKLAFSTRTENSRLWSLPFSSPTGKPTGAGQFVTPAGVNALGHDISRDGKKLAYVLQQAEKREMRERSLADGTDKLILSAEDFIPTAPRWSRDNANLAFARNRMPGPERSQQYTFNLDHSISFLSLADGNEKAVTSPDPLQGWPWDWSADGKQILGSSARQPGENWGIYLFPLAAAPNSETAAKLVAKHPEYDAFNARFSPDERWICFIAIRKTNVADAAIYVVPAAGGEWVKISSGGFYDDKPRWSSDGKAIYFLSNRSGFFNVWGEKFDPVAGKPVGEAFRVTSFDNPSFQIPSNMTEIEIAVSADRLIVPTLVVSSHVWILDSVDR